MFMFFSGGFVFTVCPRFALPAFNVIDRALTPRPIMLDNNQPTDLLKLPPQSPLLSFYFSFLGGGYVFSFSVFLLFLNRNPQDPADWNFQSRSE